MESRKFRSFLKSLKILYEATSSTLWFCHPYDENFRLPGVTDFPSMELMT